MNDIQQEDEKLVQDTLQQEEFTSAADGYSVEVIDAAAKRLEGVRETASEVLDRYVGSAGVGCERSTDASPDRSDEATS